MASEWTYGGEIPSEEWRDFCRRASYRALQDALAPRGVPPYTPTDAQPARLNLDTDE